MGLYDREYTKHDFGDGGQFPQMRFSLPHVTPVVKWLLIINIGVYLLSVIIKPLGNIIYQVFQLDSTSPLRSLQLWRLVSYQFLHDPHLISHIVFNMLGLYFLGPTLEKYWGSRKFLVFYLSCGIAGGIFYLLLSLVGFLSPGVMVGASGAILGMLAACAILFPHFVVFLIIFPVPIRLAAVLFTFMYIVNLFAGGVNAGGDAAHLAGMGAGAGYVLTQGWRTRIRLKLRADKWEKNLDLQRKLEIEVDRILQKVHELGIHSLSRKEKQILKKATKLQQLQSARR